MFFVEETYEIRQLDLVGPMLDFHCCVTSLVYFILKNFSHTLIGLFTILFSNVELTNESETSFHW